MGGHTEKSCMVGRVTCDDDVIVNSILITPVENAVIAENEVIVDAGGDAEQHTEENNDEDDDEEDDEEEIDEVEQFTEFTAQFNSLLEDAVYETDHDD